MSHIDRDDYSPFKHSKTVPFLDPGVLYPGGAHRTWGKTKVPQPYRPNVLYSSEPSGAAQARRKDLAEEKQHLRAGERLHSTDPGDPWAEAVWSPCEADCPIHHSTMDPTPKTHIDPHGAEFAVACLYCGRVHRTKTERRDIKGNVVVAELVED